MTTHTSPNPAVITKYRGPTTARGSRIVAMGGYAPCGVMTVPYDHSLSATQNHAAAAIAFIEARHGAAWAGVLPADLRPGVMTHVLMPDA